MEYDYAVAQNVPVLVFEHSNVKSLPDNKRDNKKESIEKLEAFKQKARSSRMAKMWDTHEKLLVGVMASLFNAKNDYNRPGWTRGTNINQGVLSEVEVDVNEIRKFNLKYGYSLQSIETGYVTKGTISGTLDEVFEHISVKAHETISFNEIGKTFIEITVDTLKPSFPYNIHLSDTEIAKIISQIIAFELLEPCEKDGKPLFKLSEKGLKMRNKLIL
jgi:hypothetical protein